MTLPTKPEVNKDNVRIETFLAEYVKDLNASRAYAVAFHDGKKTGKALRQAASNYLKTKAVSKRLKELLAPKLEEASVSIDAMIRETLAQAFLNPADYMTIDDDGRPHIDLKKCRDKPEVLRLLNIEFGVCVTKDGDKVHTYKVTPRDKDVAMERLFKLKRLYSNGEEGAQGRPIEVHVNFPIPASGWKQRPAVIDADAEDGG